MRLVHFLLLIMYYLKNIIQIETNLVGINYSVVILLDSIFGNLFFVKKTSNFGHYFGRFEKIKINGPHFASISHP